MKTVYAADSLETSPLARAEWLKLDAAFFNREKDMEQYFDEVARKYEELSAKARNLPNKPTVIGSGIYRGTWNMLGGKSYFAEFLKDAGANYLWSDDAAAGYNPVAIERVLDRATPAEHWIDSIYTERFNTLEDLAAKDSRYGLFRAVKEGKAYISDRQRKENGANAFFREGFANPYLILADLTEIFHPELVSEHEFLFYRQITP